MNTTSLPMLCYAVRPWDDIFESHIADLPALSHESLTTLHGEKK